jgi:hypothetical protein
VSCHVSVEVRDQEVIVILEYIQTCRKSGTVGVFLLLTCDTKNSYVTWPILSLVSIGLRLGSFLQNIIWKVMLLEPTPKSYLFSFVQSLIRA